MLSADSAFFYDDRSYRHPQPIVGGPWLVIRDGGAREWDGQRWMMAHANQLRADPLSFLPFARRAALIEPASINELVGEFAVDAAGTPWIGDNIANPTAVESVFDGQVAYEYAGHATEAESIVRQTEGVYTGSPETSIVVVEQVDAASCYIGHRNQTDNNWPYRISLNYSTGALATVDGSGTSRAYLHRPRGPGGGKVWLVRLTSTPASGKARGVWWYPRTSALGGEATKKARVHYIGHEEDAFGRYPFEDALLRDAVTAAPPPAGVALAGCLEYVAGERSGVNTGVHRVLLHIGDGHTTDSRFSIYQVNNENKIVVLYDDGTTERVAELAVTIVDGDLVVITWALDPADNRLRAQARVGSGGLVAHAPAATGGLGATWGGSVKRLRLGHAADNGANPCRLWYQRLAILRAADLLSVTDHLRIHDQCRLYRLGPDRRLLRAA